MFFIRILPVFLARVRPASHSAKPACIKNTRNAATSVQVTSAELYITLEPLFLTFAQNHCKRNRKSAGQKYSARRLCRSFVALMLSQSCTLVKREKTYFVHICKKCCTISPKSTYKIVHHVGAGHARPAAYCHILFTIQSVGEGFIPPAHLPAAANGHGGQRAGRPTTSLKTRA